MKTTKIKFLLLLLVSLVQLEQNVPKVEANPAVVVLEIVPPVLEATKLVYGHFSEKSSLSGPTGRFIYVKEKDSCLDGGWRTGRGQYTIYPHDHCPPWRMLKWSFDGRMLQLPGGLDHIEGQVCMECLGGGRDCDLKMVACSGRVEQQFFVRVHKHQIDFEKQQVYFSIHSWKFKDRCLTLYDGDVAVEECVYKHASCPGGFKLNPDSSPGNYQLPNRDFPQLCYLKSDLHSFVINKPAPMKTVFCSREVFRLEKCSNNDRQSFHLDVNWFAELDKFHSKHISVNPYESLTVPQLPIRPTISPIERKIKYKQRW